MMGISGVIETNFSVGEFQDGTQEEMIPRYNRVWDATDYTIRYNNEVQVITNLFIQPNQTQGVCPGYGQPCNDTINCVEGRTYMESGVETGRCVQYDRNLNLKTCEIRGIVSC